MNVEHIKNTVLATMNRNSQKRLSKIKSIGHELELIEQKKCELPAKTRRALEVFAHRFNDFKANGVVL